MVHITQQRLQQPAQPTFQGRAAFLAPQHNLATYRPLPVYDVRPESGQLNTNTKTNTPSNLKNAPTITTQQPLHRNNNHLFT